MMKHIIFISALVLASSMTGEAMADCSTNQVTNLGPLLLNKTVCDATATYDTCAKHPGPGCIVQMGMQEEHRGDGTLWDYKKGSTDPIDPTTQVGTWTVANDNSVNATVSYIYVGPPATTPIPYKVYSTGTGYDFCTVGGSPVASVTLTGIGSGCGSSAAPAVAPAQSAPTLRNPTLRPRSRP